MQESTLTEPINSTHYCQLEMEQLNLFLNAAKCAVALISELRVYIHISRLLNIIKLFLNR
jgi:hypothetical protein